MELAVSHIAVLVPIALIVGMICTLGRANLTRATKAAVQLLAISAFIAAAITLAQVLRSDAFSINLGGSGLASMALRLDNVSALLLLLIAFIGWVVIRYSCTYLDREPGEARFMR